MREHCQAGVGMGENDPRKASGGAMSRRTNPTPTGFGRYESQA